MADPNEYSYITCGVCDVCGTFYHGVTTHLRSPAPAPGETIPGKTVCLKCSPDKFRQVWERDAAWAEERRVVREEFSRRVEQAEADRV